jgi:hypothetical protein
VVQDKNLGIRADVAGDKENGRPPKKRAPGKI